MVDQVQREHVEWLWEERIPRGKITVVDGDPGEGKSTICYDLAARVSAARAMPDGSLGCDGAAVIISVEDDPGDTIRPRLEDAGADLERIALVDVVHMPGGERPFRLPDDVEDLRDLVEDLQARLVVLDPLMAMLSPDLSSHKDQEVRQALTPLARMAAETRAAVVIVRHLNKMAGGNPPRVDRDAGRESAAWQ